MTTATLNNASRGHNDSAGGLRLEPDSLLLDLIPIRKGEGCRLEPSSSVVEQVSDRASDGHPVPEAPWSGGGDMRLAPRQPPGRKTRKARAYASEILRLREAGYSFNAIQEALADVGVKVSRSTVFRETMRPLNTSDMANVVDAPRG